MPMDVARRIRSLFGQDDRNNNEDTGRSSEKKDTKLQVLETEFCYENGETEKVEHIGRLKREDGGYQYATDVVERGPGRSPTPNFSEFIPFAVLERHPESDRCGSLIVEYEVSKGKSFGELTTYEVIDTRWVFDADARSSGGDSDAD